MINATWAEVRLKRDAGLPMAWEDLTSHYIVRVFGPSDSFFCLLYREPWASRIVGIDAAAEAANLAEFEASYRDKANTTLSVTNEPFSAPTVAFCGNGIVDFRVTGDGQPHNIDYQLPQARLLNGGILVVSNCDQGDHFKAQIVDASGLIPEDYRFLYPAWPVLNEWIEKWGVIPNHHMDLVTPQAGEIPPGMWIRIVLTPVNDNVERRVTANFRLNRKLI